MEGRSVVAVVVFAVLAAAAVSYAGLALAGSLLLGYMTTTFTNVEDYADYVAEWDPGGNVMPAEIPAAATDVRLSMERPLWQGGSWLQLTCVLPPADYEAVVAEVGEAELSSYPVGADAATVAAAVEAARPADDDSPALGEGFDEAVRPHTQAAFAPGAVVHLYYFRGYWNHGLAFGAVLDESSRTVTWFIEQW
jgi:hypothetical protein